MAVLSVVRSENGEQEMKDKTKLMIMLIIQSICLIGLMWAMFVEDVAIEVMCGVLYLGLEVKAHHLAKMKGGEE